MSSSSAPTTTPNTSRKSLSQIIKDHHRSVTAAYETYYGAGVYTPSTSRSASVAPSSARPSADAERTMSESSIKKAWNKAIKAAKDHHDSVNAAVNVYYGSHPSSGASSAAASPRASFESPSTPAAAAAPKTEKKESGVGKVWNAAVKHVREHHQSVNAATARYYGGVPY